MRPFRFKLRYTLFGLLLGQALFALLLGTYLRFGIQGVGVVFAFLAFCLAVKGASNPARRTKQKKQE